MSDTPLPLVPTAHYRSSRLHFRSAVIEPLKPEQIFRVDTPHGSFQMTKREFYEVFDNVIRSASYREDGSYHYTKVPEKALRFLVATPPLPPPIQKPNSNRQLTADELAHLFQPLVQTVRAHLLALAKGDDGLHFALRRKLFKELTYDERSKPMQRRALKRSKWVEQGGKCILCQTPLPPKGAVLDRFEAMKGYVASNVRLLCPSCDTLEQEKKGYA